MNAVIIVIDTLRRDHLEPYGNGAASALLAEPIRTPGLQRLAERSVRFDRAYLGSFPCMPARRELWTGRYEFPWRSWGPLEDDDFDVFDYARSHGVVSALIGDHYHLVERGAGNYHFGFDGWELIRGQEHDALTTHRDPDLPTGDHLASGVWGHHLRNLSGASRAEEDLYAPASGRGALRPRQRPGGGHRSRRRARRRAREAGASLRGLARAQRRPARGRRPVRCRLVTPASSPRAVRTPLRLAGHAVSVPSSSSRWETP